MNMADPPQHNDLPASPSKLRRPSPVAAIAKNHREPQHGQRRRILAYTLLNVGVIFCGLTTLWLGTLDSLRNPSTISIVRSHESSGGKTLALLYPPGLTGGYRNQAIRFFALVEYAMTHQMTSLYLPSLLWSTKIDRLWDPIPMDWVFDIDHWNTAAASTGLPTITRHLDQSDCWMPFAEYDDPNAIVFHHHTTNSTAVYSYQNKTFNHLRRAAMLQGGLRPLFPNTTLSLLTDTKASQLDQTHKLDGLPSVEHCQHPYVFGGGKRAGRLWNLGVRSELQNELRSALYRALRPKLQLHCVPHPYTAVHARVELTMLHHPCGKRMEARLENILAQVESVSNNNTNLFIAVAKNEMAGDERFSKELLDIGRANVQFLDHMLQQPNVYECGKRILDDYYASHPDVLSRGSLLESAINFQIAVEADQFVGVQGSSYSTDVLRTRYFLGKRKGNYRYTNTGIIEQVDGLVDPHKFCK